MDKLIKIMVSLMLFISLLAVIELLIVFFTLLGGLS